MKTVEVGKQEAALDLFSCRSTEGTVLVEESWEHVAGRETDEDPGPVLF